MINSHITHIPPYVGLRSVRCIGLRSWEIPLLPLLLLLPPPLPSGLGGTRTTLAVVPLSVPVSPPTQFVGFNSEKVVSTLERSLVSLPDFSTDRRDFVLRLVCISANSFALCLDSLTCQSPWNYFQLGNVRYLRFAVCRFKSFLLFSVLRKIQGTKKVRPKCGYT